MTKLQRLELSLLKQDWKFLVKIDGVQIWIKDKKFKIIDIDDVSVMKPSDFEETKFKII